MRLSDQQSDSFALNVTGGTVGITGACEATASFRFVDGTTPGAILEILDGTSVVYLKSGDDSLLDFASLSVVRTSCITPGEFGLTTLDGEGLNSIA